MMNAKGKDLVLSILRPEYVPFPENLISSLAWRIAQGAFPGWESFDGKPVALIYKKSPLEKKKPAVHFVETRPDATPEVLDGWVEALLTSGFRLGDEVNHSAKSISDALLGLNIEKSSRQPATPLTPFIALLQNGQGVMGKAGPVNVGLILEQLFALGNPNLSKTSDEVLGVKDSVAASWYVAMRSKLYDDYFLSLIDRSVGVMILNHPLNQNNATVGELFPDTDNLAKLLQSRIEDTDDISALYLGTNTPFAWFCDAWRTLTSQRWVDALPARRWVDWATTVLRMAFGFSYIWEANWYLAIASAVTSGEENHEEKCLYSVHAEGQDPTIVDLQFVLNSPRLKNGVAMHWKDAQNNLAFRDVTPSLRITLSRGLRIRNILADFCKRNPNLSVEETMYLLRTNTQVREELIEAQREKYREQTKTVWEAVKYTLTERDSSGNKDFYGFMKTISRKYTVIDPGTEWLAVISSLAIDNPGGTGKLGTVLNELERLGLRPSVSEMTRYLESAGLAHSAADADTAVLIESAY
jgi:hypothetical protein